MFRQVCAIFGFANLYFQAGKYYYSGAPVLVGWAIGFMAARPRWKTLWPTVGLVLIAGIAAPPLSPRLSCDFEFCDKVEGDGRFG
jgi:hypothetical protein